MLRRKNFGIRSVQGMGFVRTVAARLMVSGVCLFLLGGQAFGQVKVVVELIPDNPGPYLGGETVTVDVWLRSQTTVDWRLQSVKFDFTDTDPELLLDPEFVFDFSSITESGGYARFPELPFPRIFNLQACFCPFLFLPLPAEGTLHIGAIGLQIPLTPGPHRLDVLNSAEPDFDLGARIFTSPDSKFSPQTELWTSFTGEIVGGTLTFVVLPPVPTLGEGGLLILGALFLAMGCWTIQRRRPTPNDSTRSADQFGRAVDLAREAPSRRLLSLVVIGAAVATLGFSPGIATAQSGSEPMEVVDINVDSGIVSATGQGADPVIASRKSSGSMAPRGCACTSALYSSANPLRRVTSPSCA